MSKLEIKIKLPNFFSIILFLGTSLFAFLVIWNLVTSNLSGLIEVLAGISIGLFYTLYFTKIIQIPFNNTPETKKLLKTIYYYLYLALGFSPYFFLVIAQVYNNKIQHLGIDKHSLNMLFAGFMIATTLYYGINILIDNKKRK